MRVELLWWEGCPSHPKALEQLQDLLREEGVDPQMVESRHIGSEGEAVSEGFPGSPTIRIDGEDALPHDEAAAFGLTCRVYRLRDGRPSPTPDPEDVREALRRARVTS